MRTEANRAPGAGRGYPLGKQKARTIRSGPFFRSGDRI